MQGFFSQRSSDQLDIEKLDIYSEEDNYRKIKINEKFYALPLNNY